METGELLSIVMFGTVCVVLLIGFPVAFALSGVGILFALMGDAVGAFNLAFLNAIASRFFGIMQNQILVAVPLFVFMGLVLERSRLAEDLLFTLAEVFEGIRGGMLLAVTVVGTLLAATTGILGATVVTMGLICLPSMLRAGYSPRASTGAICAAGSLGQIIPPSVVLLLLADVLAGSYASSHSARGSFLFEPFSVIDLFAGALIPGLLLAGMYLLWQAFLAMVKPELCPPLPRELVASGRLGHRVVRALVPPILLIVAVLGSIIGGIATPTEAAAFGAVGAMILALSRGQLSLATLVDVMRQTTLTTCMVFAILLGATIFATTFRGLGGEHLVQSALSSLPGGAGTAIFVVMLVIFLLGFILDAVEIIYVVVPLVAPALFAMDVSPVWLGVIIGINLQTSFLTPPFGFALFYLRGVAGPQVTTRDIYRGVMPYVGLQLIALGLVATFPAIATWLPDVLFD